MIFMYHMIHVSINLVEPQLMMNPAHYDYRYSVDINE